MADEVAEKIMGIVEETLNTRASDLLDLTSPGRANIYRDPKFKLHRITKRSVMLRLSQDDGPSRYFEIQIKEKM